MPADCWALCRHEGDWPPQLELLGGAAPFALFGRGNRRRLGRLAGEPAVTIVGARRAGPYGTEVAAALAEELAVAGIPVISGMAFGVDTAAHQGALRGGGLSVALLGAGAERPYPRSRARLYRELVCSGLVLSELPPATPTFRWMFPARNRIMAALAQITIVVEAAERSGSLITAEMAADSGRLVGAVPGPVNSWRSAGANMLIADGAAVVRDAQDVLDLLLGPGGRPATRGGRALGAGERAVLDAIEAGAGNGDAVAAQTGIAAVEVAAALSRLERAGYLQADLLGGWRRTALRPRAAVGAATAAVDSSAGAARTMP